MTGQERQQLPVLSAQTGMFGRGLAPEAEVPLGWIIPSWTAESQAR